MKRHALLLTFAVIVSLLPMTAHCDFFTDVSHAYLPGEVKPLMIEKLNPQLLKLKRKHHYLWVWLSYSPSLFPLALRSRREIALPTCLLKKAGM